MPKHLAGLMPVRRVVPFLYFEGLEQHEYIERGRWYQASYDNCVYNHFRIVCLAFERIRNEAYSDRIPPLNELHRHFKDVQI